MHLPPRGHLAGTRRIEGDVGQLDPAPVRFPARHFGHEQVLVAVGVHVGGVHRHGRQSDRAHRERRHRSEGPVAPVEPDAVGAREVVRDVQVGIPILVEVAEPRREPPVPGLRAERGARFVEEAARRRRHAPESAAALVHVVVVGLRELAATPALPGALGPEVLAVRVAHDERVPHGLEQALERELGGRKQVSGPAVLVVRHVQVEIPVRVRVRERERMARARRLEPGLARPREATGPIVQVQAVGLRMERHEQVEVRVAVHVRERRAARGSTRQVEPGRGRHVLEAPVAEVPVQRARAGDAGEEHVGTTVAIDVSQRDAGPVGEDLVLDDQVGVHLVPIRDPRPFRVDGHVSGLAAVHLELAPAVALLLPPVGEPVPRAGERRGREEDGRHAPGRAGGGQHGPGLTDGCAGSDRPSRRDARARPGCSWPGRRGHRARRARRAGVRTPRGRAPRAR